MNPVPGDFKVILGLSKARPHLMCRHFIMVISDYIVKRRITLFTGSLTSVLKLYYHTLDSVTSRTCCYECYYFFNNCIVPIGFLTWEIQVAFPGESQL